MESRNVPRIVSADVAGDHRWGRVAHAADAGPARRPPVRWVVVLLLAVHSGLLAWAAYRDSATWDEVGHFAAGLSHWYDRDFTLYRVNPPLVRLVAVAPVALREPRLDLGPYTPDLPRASPFLRDDFLCGQRVAEALGPRYFRLLAFSRWAVIPFSIIGGWVCYLWATDLYGGASGLLAAALWAFCPSVLAYGHLILPDVGAAAMGVAAMYLFWRWLRQPAWRRAAAAGVVLGLAELTKTTWLFLFILWPVAWLACRPPRTGNTRARWFRREGLQLGAMIVLAVWIINLGYGYEGSFRPLDSFTFGSRALTGAPLVPATPEAPPRITGNRFQGTWLGRAPVPFPSNYVRGIDFVKWEYERGYWSYLNGEWRLGGWWYYYLYAMLVKEPLGMWALGVLAVGCVVFWRRAYAGPWRNEMLLLAPGVAVIALVSSQTGFNHHVRYVLPAYPFLFILISRVGKSFELGHRGVAVAVCLLLGWSIISSLTVVPHSMSYFNELAGGPKRGHWHLGNSNADWGQDLLYLKAWYDKHPEARPLQLGYDLPLIDPRTMLGIDWHPVPVGPSGDRAALEPPEGLGPKPGWYAIGVNWLHDGHHRYDYFHDLVPVDWVGYTMPIYHITNEQANALRRRYGMAELPVDQQHPGSPALGSTTATARRGS
jgi:hypothetical protein